MKIAVIGAGVSGLTFVAAMRHFAPGTQVELYEIWQCGMKTGIT